MADKAPAFQFYVKDWLSDERVQLMSLTEKGAYIDLICFCWNEGSLPLETDRLARLLNLPLPRFTKLWENSSLRQCFYVGEDGRLHHKRLDEEREKQDTFRRRQSDKGKASAAARGSTAVQPNGNRGSTAVQPRPVQPEGNSSSAICNLQTAVSLPSERVIAEPDVSDRARWLLESYVTWYRDLRHGARLRLVHNALEFQDACDLCRHWDDARLKLLAKIVLTTDDPYISGTDRSFKIFAQKASWADDRLTQAEKAIAV